MSKVVYLLGAGASRGERGDNGEIFRGVPVINEFLATLNSLIDNYKISLEFKGDQCFSYFIDELSSLTWKCLKYPTIDTYARQLFITDNDEYLKLKKRLALFLTLVQVEHSHDMRYDGFIASIIKDNGQFPKDISILSWNYDHQFESSFQCFTSSNKTLRMQDLWERAGISCKAYMLQTDHIPCRPFMYKLNGTAFVTRSDNPPHSFEELLMSEDKYKSIYEAYTSDKIFPYLSFAWESPEISEEKLNPYIEGAEVLVVIGYSFPYVNRKIDRMIVQNLPKLKKVYIQDPLAKDVRQSLVSAMSEIQRDSLKRGNVEVQLLESTNQFFIPPEL